MVGEELTVTVYQLSAQFPGPTSPREFITLLITSDTCLTDASKVGDTIPRHYMVVSIPVSHPDAPLRSGMVRGFYESIEMIREIPLADGDAETNPVEWIMVTRSDPGGGIPRFMVERNVPSSIVQDAVKFLDWACAKPETEAVEKDDNAPPKYDDALGVEKRPDQARRPSFAETNGMGAGAGVGTSIAERPSSSVRRASQRAEESGEGFMAQIRRKSCSLSNLVCVITFSINTNTHPLRRRRSLRPRRDQPAPPHHIIQQLFFLRVQRLLRLSRRLHHHHAGRPPN